MEGEDGRMLKRSELVRVARVVWRQDLQVGGDDGRVVASTGANCTSKAVVVVQQ